MKTSLVILTLAVLAQWFALENVPRAIDPSKWDAEIRGGVGQKCYVSGSANCTGDNPCPDGVQQSCPATRIYQLTSGFSQAERKFENGKMDVMEGENGYCSEKFTCQENPIGGFLFCDKGVAVELLGYFTETVPSGALCLTNPE